ncbi:MAG: radical SAM protein [Eubacterium sp.]|nr:radical SAM protein [Eubacterium sp.]
MKQVAIWGTGESGQKVYDMLKVNPVMEVAAFADRDMQKQGKALHGMEIISPEELLSLADDGKIDVIIFAFANHFYKEAAAMFKNYHIEAYIVPRYIQSFFKEYTSIEECLIPIDLSKPRIKQFDVNLVDHCNMKCKGCLRYSNLVEEPFFADFDKMIADWTRMKELFWGVERLKLMGGEPMLSPDLCRYIKHAREIFPDADIMVTTNALLINENCTELFQVMKENYCFFDISLYAPMRERIGKVEEILQKNGVWYGINDAKGDFYKVLSREPKYDMDEAYEKCTARNCHHLREGKLSVCSRPQYAYIMNERYHTNIPGDDGVWDIYHLNMDAWELDKKLSSGFEACKYCAPPVAYEWGRATVENAQMSDWFVD